MKCRHASVFLGLLGLSLAACAPTNAVSDPNQGHREGTFVGNPSLQARIADNAEQRVTSGLLEALEVHVTSCEDAPKPLGPTHFKFVGASAEETVPLPVGEHCGLFFVVDLFTVNFEDEGELVTIVADDFDIEIPATFAASTDQQYVLRLGDEAWLADVAALAQPGVNRLGPDVPELSRVFYNGLIEGSDILLPQ